MRCQPTSCPTLTLTDAHRVSDTSDGKVGTQANVVDSCRENFGSDVGGSDVNKVTDSVCFYTAKCSCCAGPPFGVSLWCALAKARGCMFLREERPADVQGEGMGSTQQRFGSSLWTTFFRQARLPQVGGGGTIQPKFQQEPAVAPRQVCLRVGPTKREVIPPPPHPGFSGWVLPWHKPRDVPASFQ